MEDVKLKRYDLKRQATAVAMMESNAGEWFKAADIDPLLSELTRLRAQPSNTRLKDERDMAVSMLEGANEECRILRAQVEWHDIAGAPKDGTNIWVAAETKKYTGWNTGMEVFWKDGEWHEPWSGQAVTALPITHYRLLPSPPMEK